MHIFLHSQRNELEQRIYRYIFLEQLNLLIFLKSFQLKVFLFQFLKLGHFGIMAIVVGLAMILGFMLLYYKGAGFNACVAQILNLYIMFSVLSAFNLTITLPSIAGMILTIDRKSVV